MEVPMAAQIVSATEDFVRSHFGTAIDERRPIGPTARTILDTLMTETASHVGAEELRPYGDANRFVVKLVLATLTERYSMASVTLVRSLGKLPPNRPSVRLGGSKSTLHFFRLTDVQNDVCWTSTATHRGGGLLYLFEHHQPP
jgi:hypothetical protein